jgi:hypothetical protein
MILALDIGSAAALALLCWATSVASYTPKTGAWCRSRTYGLRTLLSLLLRVTYIIGLKILKSVVSHELLQYV